MPITQGKIILLWLFVLFRYNLRPKLYLFNKRVCNFREDYPEPPKEPMPKASTAKLDAPVELVKLGSKEQAHLYVALDDPVNRLCFEMNKKGGLNVRISKVQE